MNQRRNDEPAPLLRSWIVGVMIGTAIIAITSPLFVRSYLPRQSNRSVATLPAGAIYRWRSEGYADTRIGPLGMPGKTTFSDPTNVEPAKRITRIALWGDSQAEGVCVGDQQKIFALAETLSDTCEVFPLAQSGDDAADWLAQFPTAENELSVDLHVLLIVDLPDLLTATGAPAQTEEISSTMNLIATWLPAFVIQSARNLLAEADGTTRRTLRFSIGPQASSKKVLSPPTHDERVDWTCSAKAIASSTARPIVILYAPIVPQIIAGKIVTEDPQSTDFALMRRQAESAGMIVVDARPDFQRSASVGDWPHGFHNGQIGTGHLNAIGNRIVATKIVEAVAEKLQ